MLWVSPIEQVIKEINFATYHTKQAKFHYMNILTTTADVSNMTWNGNSIASHFHPLMGNSDYSFARIEIPEGNHHLKGSVGFLAHVYGYGERESYAYSCGSSTIQRSVTFNGSPLMIDSTYHGKFCVNEDIEMKLNIGNNDYESILWDYGDGITYVAPTNISNDEKKKTSHTYTVPGWYDLKVTAVYINQCTGTKHNEEMRFSFRVVRADTILVAPKDSCISLADQAQIIADHGQAYLDSLVANGGRTILNPDAPCYEDKQLSFVKFDLETETVLDSTVRDGVDINGTWYDASTTVTWTVSQPHKCDQHFTCNLTVITCLEMNVTNNPEAQHVCPPQSLAVAYTKTKGSIKSARFVVEGILDKEVTFSDANTQMGTIELPTESLRKPGVYHGKLIVEDLYCGDIFTYPIDFMVYYPSDIFRYKFNNVLAVYNSGFGGNTGYTFKAYQWYLNYQAIEGATEPVLYLGDGVTFAIGDVVYVALTDMNDVTIPSCPQTIKDVPDYTAPETNNAPARKMLINGQFVIEKGDGTYDIYGQKVQ